MPKLKEKPRRRLKLTVRPLPTTPSMASASTPEDTIRVQQRLADVEISDDDDDAMEQDDHIEEYDFSNEPDDDDDEEDDGLDTAHYKYPNGVMPISSDDEDDNNRPEENWQPTIPPWRVNSFSVLARSELENMYCELPDYAMKDSAQMLDWDVTEEYIRERDNEMLGYLEDYPLPQWVIPQAKAQDAHNRLLDRVRWRNLGLPIYRRPGVRPMSSQPFQSVATQMPPPLAQHRHPSQFMPSPRQAGPPHAAGPQNSQSQHMTDGMGGAAPTHARNGMPPPPSAVLPSQPIGQPTSTQVDGTADKRHSDKEHPGGAHAHGSSATVAAHGPTYGAPATRLTLHASGSKGKARAQRNRTPPVDGSGASPPTPPYETRPRPPERKASNKAGRRKQGRHAEADVFPWNRDLDFKTARDSAAWNDDIYDEATLAAMEATRTRNMTLIKRADSDPIERQRLSRMTKKNRFYNVEGSSDVENSGRQSGVKLNPPRPKTGETGSGDAAASGSFMFATVEDHQRATNLGWNTPDDIMLAYEDGEISLEVCAQITIFWNPGKKSSMQELEQGRFTIKDSVLTREQIDSMPILTHAAGERVVDFCPDLLFRDLLLRITAEAGFGNKEIRDRMCYNGNYVDKATITKRIGAALGQKQLQAATKSTKKPDGESSDTNKKPRYVNGEDEYYNTNVTDFSNYMEFFGHRTSHRNYQLKQEAAKRKRELESGDREDSSGLEEIIRSPRKRKRSELESVRSPETLTSSGEITGLDGADDSEAESEAIEDGRDVVSVQSDTLLDEMDED